MQVCQLNRTKKVTSAGWQTSPFYTHTTYRENYLAALSAFIAALSLFVALLSVASWALEPWAKIKPTTPKTKAAAKTNFLFMTSPP